MVEAVSIGDEKVSLFPFFPGYELKFWENVLSACTGVSRVSHQKISSG